MFTTMMNTLLCGGLLISSLICVAADQNKRDEELALDIVLAKIPIEVVRKYIGPHMPCLPKAEIVKKVSYPIEKKVQQMMCLKFPETMPTRPQLISEENANNSDSDSHKTYLPYTQCYVSLNGSFNGSAGVIAFVYDDEAAIHEHYAMAYAYPDKVFFDGINKKGRAVLCFVTVGRNKSCRYRMNFMPFPSHKCDRMKVLEWQYADGGNVKAIALHHESNQVALIVEKDTVNSLFIYDESKGETAMRANISANVCKVAYCGDNNYVLMGRNSLAIASPKQDSDFIVVGDCSQIVNGMLNKTNSELRDIAVNFTMEKCKQNAWAFLCIPQGATSNVLQGKLIIYTLSHKYALNKETENALMLVSDIPDAHLVENIYFEGSTVTVVYSASEELRSLARMETYKINIAELFFEYVKEIYAPAYAQRSIKQAVTQ